MTSRSGTYESGIKMPRITITDPEDKNYATESKGVKPLEVFENTEDTSGAMFSPIQIEDPNNASRQSAQQAGNDMTPASFDYTPSHDQIMQL